MSVKLAVKVAITPTDHDKSEWARMSQDAYRHGRPNFGVRYAYAASIRGSIPTDTFDALQYYYRQWLIGGWAGIED